VPPAWYEELIGHERAAQHRESDDDGHEPRNALAIFSDMSMLAAVEPLTRTTSAGGRRHEAG